MRTLAIGDIHGHLRALDALLNSVGPKPDDRIVFLGDYVDKGPDVKGLLDRMVQLRERPNVVFLRGNHDEMLVHAYRNPPEFSVWECLAGENALASYGGGDLREVIGKIPSEHWSFLEETCRDYFETPEHIFVHAGIRAHVAPAEEDRERLLWTSLLTAASHHSGRTVICGHSSQRSGHIADLGHTICLDTGITSGGRLTCLDVETLEFWQSTATGECFSGRLLSADRHG